MIREAIEILISGRSLSLEQAAAVMEEITGGTATPAQFGAFVTALRLKGESVDEIAGMAKVMREKAVHVTYAQPVVDTCGTGGDSQNTFNVSTAAAFVGAAAGLKVAKHGNRAMTSRCGSADVLEALGVKIDLTAEQVSECLEEVGIGFMFAPAFHPAMKYAAGLRREVGIRTIFNILGPLTNPAGADSQVVGVPDVAAALKLAQALQKLGSRHALVVHGEDGMDEVSVTAHTTVCELVGGNITKFRIAPEFFGLSRAHHDSLRGGSAAGNADILRKVFQGEKGPRRDVVLLNSAAVLLAGDKAGNLKEGIELAREALDSGKALEKMERLAAFTRRYVH
ncbi:MAG: anthranilate phosphoribosyltransferase [Dehalococcoidia bacterium]|nr:anthranilate phosphoribosyltransferase [Dehalococcoidia bacterium]